MRHFLIVAVTAGAVLVPAHAADLREFKGEYQLADGRSLTIAGGKRQLVARLDGQPDAELVAVGEAVFVSRRGDLRLAFTQHANGKVSGLTLTAPKRLRRE